jgi:tRNA dimethylallyltransferase
MKNVRHHFINSHSIKEEFSAGRFEAAALQLLEQLFRKQNPVVLTGGSGLYVQALCEGMNDIPRVPKRFREQLYTELNEKGLTPLAEELQHADPDYFEKVDLKNQQRVIRALEVCRATGRPYSSFRSDKPVQRPFRMIRIGLNLPREELFERIDRRVDEMVKKGLFEEAEQLLPFRDTYALQTVGYKEVFGFLDGEYDREEAVRLIKRNTRRYAKRQLTWFKRYREIQWFEPDQIDEITDYIHSMMKS